MKKVKSKVVRKEREEKGVKAKVSSNGEVSKRESQRKLRVSRRRNRKRGEREV